MTPERWERVEELYHAAYSRPAGERAAFLAASCREDETLRGAGGMGEVYRSRDAKLGRDVAIKILPRAFTSHPDAHYVDRGCGDDVPRGRRCR